MFEDCGNCIAMEQSGYISEWQIYFDTHIIIFFKEISSMKPSPNTSLPHHFTMRTACHIPGQYPKPDDLFVKQNTTKQHVPSSVPEYIPTDFTAVTLSPYFS